MVKKKKSDDISNKTVVLMLVAFILVSVISLGVYMDALEEAPKPKGLAAGEVSLYIEEAPSGPTATQSSAGEVSLNILKPN